MKTNQNLRLFDGKKDEINSHAELVSASSTQAVLPLKQQRQALKTLKQVQGDLVITTTNGFTLIELLVVVLIISILTAVAVPQYQKSVTKSRATQLQTILSTVAQASNVYHLQTGEQPTSFDQLDIDIDLPSGGAVCAGDWVPSSTKKGNDFEVSLYNGGIDKRYRIAIFFTEGKYKCTGFAHILQNNQSVPTPELDGKSFCAEAYYRRSCGTDCDNGDFCKKIMGLNGGPYVDTVYLYK